MTVTIQMPWLLASRPPRARAASPKPRRRTAGKATAADRTTSGGFVKKAFYLLFLSLPIVTLIQTVLARDRGVLSTRSDDVGTVESDVRLGDYGGGGTMMRGPHWAYAVPFGVRNKKTIEKLIQCESGGQNVSAPDTDGITSDGILQFHRGPSDTMTRGTWEDFSHASGITGSPRDPVAAIRMTDWAISHGLGPRWGCWQREQLRVSATEPLPAGAFRGTAPSWR